MSVTPETTLVLITGANQGIGYYITKQLTTENKNYHVIMGGRDIEKTSKVAAELQSQGLSVEPIVIDVNLDESIAEAAKQVEAKYGRLDVLINNAGITHRKVDPEIKSNRLIFQAVFNTNVFGAYEVTEAFIPLLRKSTKTKRIIFVSSTVGSLQMRTNPKTATRRTPFAAYPTSKTAMNMICLHYSVMFENDGWKVNSHCPGHCKTNLNGFTAGQPPEIGAQNAVRLATLGEDGETGTWSDQNGRLPW